MRFPVYIVLGFAGFSCQKEIPLTAEEKQSRIVINGVFEAGKPVKIDISQSKDILYGSWTMPPLENVAASLYDSDFNLLGNFIHDSMGMYHLPITVQEGTSYILRASSDGFTDVVARINLPEKIANVELEAQNKVDFNEYTFTITDNPNESNFYVLYCELRSYQSGSWEDGFGGNEQFCSKNLVFQNDQASLDGNVCSSRLLFSDQSFNGTDFTFMTSQSTSVGYGDSLVSIVTLKSISEDLYKYILTSDMYNEVQTDPFSQPVRVHTNVENGFGILGGASTFSDTIYW